MFPDWLSVFFSFPVLGFACYFPNALLQRLYIYTLIAALLEIIPHIASIAQIDNFI